MTGTRAGGSAPGILSIIYDGMLEPLGQSQLVADLEKLAAGVKVYTGMCDQLAKWVSR